MKKKFYVARMFEYSTPSIVFITESEDDARSIAEIYARADGKEYAVMTLA